MKTWLGIGFSWIYSLALAALLNAYAKENDIILVFRVPIYIIGFAVGFVPILRAICLLVLFCCIAGILKGLIFGLGLIVALNFFEGLGMMMMRSIKNNEPKH